MNKKDFDRYFINLSLFIRYMSITLINLVKFLYNITMSHHVSSHLTKAQYRKEEVNCRISWCQATVDGKWSVCGGCWINHAHVWVDWALNYQFSLLIVYKFGILHCPCSTFSYIQVVIFYVHPLIFRTTLISNNYLFKLYQLIQW